MRRFEQAGYKLIETDDGHWLTTYGKGPNKGEPRPVLTDGVRCRMRPHRELFQATYSVKLNHQLALKRECDHPGCVRPEHWTYKSMTPTDLSEIQERLRRGHKIAVIARDMDINRDVIDKIWYKMRNEGTPRNQHRRKSPRRDRAPWRTRTNPFYVMCKKHLFRAEKVMSQIVRLDDEIVARIARKERSSVAELEQEKRLLAQERVDHLKKARHFSWKGRTWWALNEEAKELRGVKMPEGMDDNE